MVSDSGTPRDDRRRARHIVQPEACDRRRPDRARVANWRRSQWFDQTGLPWTNPLRPASLAALTSYPGSVYFEGTNLAEGRGTDRPFEQIWGVVAEGGRCRSGHERAPVPGVRFEAITMPVAPTAAKFPDRRFLRSASSLRTGRRIGRFEHRSSIDRCDTQAASDRRVEPVDRSPDGLGQGAARDPRGPTSVPSGRMGSRSRGLRESRKPFLLYP